MKEKILLAALPFWAPLIPPLGIACLKGFLKGHGFRVKTVDANMDDTFLESYHAYFDTLKTYVPPEKRGNFYNTGHDTLRWHMMAHINYTKERDYIELVKRLISRNFFCGVDDVQVMELNRIIAGFYRDLAAYLLDLIEEEKPTVLGLSVNSGSLPASLFAFKLTRAQYPHIRTVMGGGVFADLLAWGSPNLEFFLEKIPYIDKIILGEGEQLLLKWLQGELPENQRVYTLKDINGQTVDLSLVGIPDFSDFDLAAYPYLAAYGSRSCLFQCEFCAETVNWGKYRKKSPVQVVKELKTLNQTYGFQLFLMSDSLLNPIITDLAKELLRSEVSLYWEGYLRADTRAGDIENTMLWRQAGFYRASLGVESGSPRILGEMGKKISLTQIKKAISSLAFAGIKTTTYWVIGFPGETEEDFQQTLNLIEELRDDIYEAECNAYVYYLTGQVNSGKWHDKAVPLFTYPGTARDMLIAQPWSLDTLPTREETYSRVSRFVQHCKKLGIPNPYSMREIYQADERWQKMHKNTVPPLVAFKNKGHRIEDRKNIKKLVLAPQVEPDQGDFDF